MKTLIKKYYNEPQVDSVRIMKYISEQNTEKSLSEIFFVSIIAAGLLLLTFLYFLVNYSIEFLPTVIGLYFAIGNILLLFVNLIAGILIFIMSHWNTMLLFVTVIAGIQIGILHSHMRTIIFRQRI